jgi:deoxyuridine 5'-triphosphate nucleotidohydrolase|tara:strand:- start:463 stop:1083 length:621 start_codon:yes stop_codon:yes gene_type:complete
MEEADTIAEYSKQCCEIAEINSVYSDATGYKFSVTWDGSEAIDFLYKLNDSQIFSPYLAPLTPSQTLITNIVKTRDDAVIPSRAHFSDSGFDITIIDVIKTNGDVTFYSTGIKAQPPHGYYFELFPRSSISKTGYMLANNVGIIDQNYRGEIIVALRKIDKNKRDIELPCKIAQLIPKQWYNMNIEEEYELKDTHRSEGGFGSTTS